MRAIHQENINCERNKGEWMLNYGLVTQFMHNNTINFYHKGTTLCKHLLLCTYTTHRECIIIVNAIFLETADHRDDYRLITNKSKV